MENGNIRKNDDGLLRLCYVKGDVDGMLGLHLSRAPWDPYPWVSGVQSGSSASIAGLQVGDCVLEVNGENVLGQKIVEVAEKIRQNCTNAETQYEVTFLLWNSKLDEHEVNPQHLQKFALCLQNIAQLLECPICLEVAKPPAWQCQNGHVLCDNCRGRTSRCPICRVTLGPKGRCLLAEKVFTLLADSFPCENGESKWKHSKHLENKHDSQTHHRHQKNVPKKSFTLETVITHPVIKVDQFKYNCLSCSSSCAKMKSQHELLIHLQRNHKISVTQYYAALGDKINIKFSDKSVTSIVIPKNDNLEVFFVVKMRFSSGHRGISHGRDVCWIWYYGDAVDANLYTVKLECSKTKWRGVVNSLEISVNDIINLSRYAVFEWPIVDLIVEIK